MPLSHLPSCAGMRRVARNTGRVLLVMTLLSQTIFVAGLSSASAQKKKKNKKKKATAERTASPLPPIVMPSTQSQSAATTTPVNARRTPATGDGTQDSRPVQNQPIEGSPVAPVSVSEVSFTELALKQQASPKVLSPVVEEAIHPPLSIDDSVNDDSSNQRVKRPKNLPQPPIESVGPNVVSPSPSQSFLGQEDGPKVGTSTFNIPPDTNGAVGLDKIFSNTNPNYRVQNKATGAALSTVSSDTFWASSGGSGFFDPQIVYDPYNNRWILAMASNSGTANSSIEIAVSQTSDPSGSYNVFRFVVGCAGGAAGCNVQGEWADFPMLGFNKNWIAVSMNIFQIVGTGAGGAQLNNNDKTLVVDYPAARAGTATATLFSGAAIGFCNYPVQTHSGTENTLYLAQHLSSGGATYKISTITGTSSAPTFTLGVTLTRPGGGWTQPGGDNAPQQCIPGVSIPTQTCPATARGIDVGDAQVRSNPVFRNGKVWYSQTIALPAGGLTINSRFVAQWTAVNATTGAFVDGGRVEDATATLTNGGKHYIYPSLAVNKNDDVLLGFSESESDDYIDAGYAFRLGSDAGGTMRDPVIYKEGEDYYEKTFGGTRNRWGDYSHTLVDPSNDNDLWTVQEYAQARVGTTGTGSNDSRWGTWWAKLNVPAGAGDLIISEFKLHGLGVDNSPSTSDDATDEFIEIYNTGASAHTVTTVDGSAGYGVAASDGVLRCTIPNGTVIPGRGHYLCANSSGYSFGGYPAGNGTATPDATYTTDIPINAGIALFSTSNPANFALARRLDAVGSTSEANTLYKEGTGYAAIATAPLVDSFVRDMCGKGGSTTATGRCTQAGIPKDTNDNATDFIFVDANGTSTAAGQRLGAPGPENLSSPILRNSTMAAVLLDATVISSAAPNRVRDFTPGSGSTSSQGTLDIRRRIVNTTGAPVTRLRFRVIDMSTFPVPAGEADLRAITSNDIVVSNINDGGTCGAVQTPPAVPPTAPCTVTVHGTLLETPPAQANGGGFNSSLSAGAVTLATPLAPGASINIRFLLGVQTAGQFKFIVNIDALP